MKAVDSCKVTASFLPPFFNFRRISNLIIRHMITSVNAKKLLLAAIIAFSGVTGYTQEAGCKVSMLSIS
ncbi:MAG: hypothetical protein MZV63_16350, partial [Marinilabiliales bacterium]|nr:hypothetical protein [Marinilabiliales bacterium]